MEIWAVNGRDFEANWKEEDQCEGSEELMVLKGGNFNIFCDLGSHSLRSLEH